MENALSFSLIVTGSKGIIGIVELSKCTLNSDTYGKDLSEEAKDEMCLTISEMLKLDITKQKVREVIDMYMKIGKEEEPIHHVNMMDMLDLERGESNKEEEG